MNIKKISLGFPVNKTDVVNYTKVSEYFYPGDKDVNLKIIIQCTADQRAAFNEKDFCEKVLDNAKVKSVKVVYDIQKALHVRSEKIVNLKTLKEKFIEYADVEKIDYTQDVLDAVEELDSNLEIKHFHPKHEFRLLSVKLRGAIGLKKKSNLEEYVLDLEKYPSGLIALCGENGCGKTTLLENCHPYPRLLTRRGTLQDHFFLRDSLRELLYVDEESTYYKISMMIDGQTKNGKVKYFVSTGKDRDNLVPVKDCDGNADPYNKWVEQTFGPVELYLRTAFFAKEQTYNVPDISRASKGEKKELFSTLIGIDYLKDVSEAAKENAKKADEEVKVLQRVYKDVNFEEEITSAKAELKKCNKDLKAAETSKDKYEKEINSIKDTLKERKTSVSLADLRLKKHNLEAQLFQANNCMKAYTDWEEDNERKVNILKKCDEYEKAGKKCDEYEEKEYTPAKSKYDSLLQKIESLENSINYARINIDTFKKNAVLEVETICPTCGQPVSESLKKKLQKEVDKNVAKVNKLQESLKEQEEELKLLNEQLSSINMDKISSKYEELQQKRDDCLSEIPEDELAVIQEQIKSLEAVKKLYSKEDLENQIKDVNEQLSSINKQISDAQANDVSDLENSLKDLEERYDEVSEDIKEMYRKIGGLEGNIEGLKKEKEENDKAGEELSRLQKEVSKWKLISKSFGADGIQALELEAMSPEIAIIANNILSSAYGDRFKLSFQTLRVGSSGQLIEDFNILVEDSTDGSCEPIEWLSSGEAVWIKAALYNAFSIVRMRNTGVGMKVIFADEVDGSLDSESRLRYVKMIKTAHEECNAVQTIMITHSSELKETIENRINF